MPLRHRLSGHSRLIGSIAIAWSSDGLFLVSGSYDETIRKWNTSSGECELTIKSPDWIYAVALSPDNKHILSGGDRGVHVWDSSTGQIVFGPLHSPVCSVAYSPNGQYFVSGSWDGSVIIWDSTTGTNHLAPFKAHSSIIHSIAFHPTGKTFATMSADETIVVWDANTFKSTHKFANVGLHLVTNSIQYSPNGRSILTASNDQIKVLDTQTGKVRNKSDDGVNAAAFSPDGRWVASGSGQGSVKVWEFLEYDT